MSLAMHVPAVPEDSADLPHVTIVVDSMTTLINEKAWQLLRMTGQEFSLAWYAGDFTGSTDPDVVALDRLMRTGTWSAPARDVLGAS